MLLNLSSRRREAALFQTSDVSTAPWSALTWDLREFHIGQYREIGLHPQRIVGVLRPFPPGDASERPALNMARKSKRLAGDNTTTSSHTLWQDQPLCSSE
jgi:hypothetical protein